MPQLPSENGFDVSELPNMYLNQDARKVSVYTKLLVPSLNMNLWHITNTIWTW